MGSTREDRTFAEVAAIVSRHDPEHLLAIGAPSNEYECEVGHLAELLRRATLPLSGVQVLEAWQQSFGARSKLSISRAKLIAGELSALDATDAGHAAALVEFFEHATRGAPRRVNWYDSPWATARPGLHWLGLAPEKKQTPHSLLDLEPTAARVLAQAMGERFWSPDGLAWSSGAIESALQAFVASAGSPPEPLLEALWSRLRKEEFNERVAAFCREVGRQVLGRYRDSSGWDLRWATGSANPSQACLRYWVFGVRPTLWNDELEAESHVLQRRFSFGFGRQ